MYTISKVTEEITQVWNEKIPLINIDLVDEGFDDDV